MSNQILHLNLKQTVLHIVYVCNVRHADPYQSILGMPRHSGLEPMFFLCYRKTKYQKYNFSLVCCCTCPMHLNIFIIIVGRPTLYYSIRDCLARTQYAFRKLRVLYLIRMMGGSLWSHDNLTSIRASTILEPLIQLTLSLLIVIVC